MARDPTTGYKVVERKPVSTLAPPTKKPKKLDQPVPGMNTPMPLLAGGPPVTPLLAHGVQLNIHEVNDKVAGIVDAHTKAVGYPPKPAFVFDILKADPHIQKAGISYDQLFGVPKNTRQQQAMVASRAAVNPIDPIAPLPVVGAKVPMPMTPHELEVQRAVTDYRKGAKTAVYKHGLPPDYGYTHGLGLAPGDEVQLMGLADIGRPAGFLWKATKQIIDTTASLPTGMVFMGSSIGADVRDMTTYGLAPLAAATNNLPLPGPQQHFRKGNLDFHRTRALGVGMAKGVWYDVTHPYDQAGYLVLDLFGGYSAAAGVGSRIGRAAAAEGVRASTKALVRRPPPGYYELSLGGYSESIPMFNNSGARLIQSMVLKHRQKKLGDSLTGDQIMQHSKVADLVFSSHVYLKRATDNKVAIQYAVLMTPSVEFTRLSGFRARAGIAMDAIKSDPKLVKNFRSIGASKIAAMDKAVELMFIDDPTPVRTARNFHLKELQNLQSLERDIRGSGVDMEAMTDQEVKNALRNVDYQVANHQEQLLMIDVAESMLKNPIRQWPEYLRRAQGVADAQEYLKKLHMGLDEDIAHQAVAKLGAFYRRDPLVDIGEGRLGVVQEVVNPLDPNHITVYHGTIAEPFDQIAADKGIHGTSSYGKGIYFSESPTRADNYTRVSHTGKQPVAPRVEIRRIDPTKMIDLTDDSRAKSFHADIQKHLTAEEKAVVDDFTSNPLFEGGTTVSLYNDLAALGYQVETRAGKKVSNGNDWANDFLHDRLRLQGLKADTVSPQHVVFHEKYLHSPHPTSYIPDVKKLEQHVKGQTKSVERAQRLVKSAEAKLRAADARDAKAGKEPRQRLVEEAAKQPPLGETPTDVRGRALLNVEETLAVRRGDLVTVNAPKGDFRHLGNFKDTKGRIIGEYVSKDERVLVDLNTGEEIQRTKLGEKPKVTGSRTDEQVVADARKRLKELEKVHNTFFAKWREKMFGKETPEDKAEQLRRNNENAAFDRQQAGVRRKPKANPGVMQIGEKWRAFVTFQKKHITDETLHDTHDAARKAAEKLAKKVRDEAPAPKSGASSKAIPHRQKTVKEEQNVLVEQAIDEYVKKNPDDPAVKTMLAERAEIQSLKDQLNPMPGESIDANLLRAPDEPRPTAEELAGVKVKAPLTHEEEALRRAQAQEKRAQRGLAKATAELEKVREAAKPLVKKMEESRYYPSRRRIYQEGAKGPFRAGRKNKYGVAPPELPASLRYRNDGTSLIMGDRRYDTSDLLPQELMMTTKAATQMKLWHDLWESGVNVPAGTMTHPIRDVKNAPQHLKEMVTSLEHARITKESAENFTEGNLKELREWAVKDDPEVKEDPHVRYVDDRMLMDYFTNGEFWRAVDQRASKWASPVNDPLRFLMIFATPAYLLNALGSAVTLLSEYQMGAAPNLGRALNSTHLWDGEATRLLDTLGGETHTSSLITERGKFAKSYQGFAEMWQLVTDRPFRRAAVIGELRRAGVPIDEMSTQEFKDVLSMKDTRYEKEVIGSAMRAQDAMLNFGKMSWPERAILRHLVFVYAFMRASTAWSIRFQIEHPIQSATLAQAGKERAQQIEDQIGNVDEWFMRRGYFPVGKGLWFDPIQANMPGMFGEVAYPFMSLFRDTPYASIQDTLGPAAQIASSAVTGRDSQGRELPHSGYGRLADTALSVYQATPFGYAQARAEKRKKEKPLPPASVNPGTYNPQDAALNQERAALDLSPFELDSWWQTWGRNIGRSAVPYKIDEAALNARYWRTTKENNPAAYEQHQIDAVVGKGGMIDRMEQLAGESSGPDVTAGVEMIMRVSLFVDKEANDWKKHHLKMPNPGPRAKGIWTIDSLLDQKLISPSKATAMKKELNDAPPRMQDALRIKAMLDNGGKAWTDWNAHVQEINWFGKQSYADTVGMLGDDGVGDYSPSIHAPPETKWRYGRGYLAWDDQHKQLSAQADKAGPNKQVRKAELIEFENESKPVKVNGVAFPSYVAMHYGKLTPAAQASHKLATSLRPWETLNSFDRSLLVGDTNAEAAQGWTALAQVRAREQAKLPLGKSLPQDFTKQVVEQIAKQLPAFGRDYNFSKQPLATRMSAFKPITGSRFADKWSTLLGTATARYDALHKQKAPQGFINDQWARNDVPKVSEWIKQQPKGFQAQVLLYEKDHPDFLKDLVKP